MEQPLGRHETGLDGRHRGISGAIGNDVPTPRRAQGFPRRNRSPPEFAGHRKRAGRWRAVDAGDERAIGEMAARSFRCFEPVGSCRDRISRGRSKSSRAPDLGMKTARTAEPAPDLRASAARDNPRAAASGVDRMGASTVIAFTLLQAQGRRRRTSHRLSSHLAGKSVRRTFPAWAPTIFPTSTTSTPPCRRCRRRLPQLSAKARFRPWRGP